MTPPRRRRRLTLVGLFVVVTTVLSSCASNAPLDTFDPQGPDARRLDNLIQPVFWVAGVVLLFVSAATIYMIVRFRASKHPEGDVPTQTHGNTRLEIGWTVVPAMILAVIAVFTVAEMQNLTRYDRERGLDVVVVGHQWWWEYRYYFDGFDPKTDYDPEINPIIENVTNREGKTAKTADIVTATQLVVPANREIVLTITSRDIIHSFWIPNLNGKRDAVPGRMSPWKIQADQPGVYFGQCTEYCGLSHSRMRMQVVALADDEFDDWVEMARRPVQAPSPASAAWLAQQREINAGRNVPVAQQLPAPDDTAAERGMVLFIGQCTRCHLANGINDDLFVGAQQVSGAAPDLTLFANRTMYAGGIFRLYNADGSVDRPQLEAWLRNPPGEKAMAADLQRGMPNLNLSEPQIDDLVEFLLTLGPRPSDFVIAETQHEIR
jgi:cytochrome c oxidase subunit II